MRSLAALPGWFHGLSLRLSFIGVLASHWALGIPMKHNRYLTGVLERVLKFFLRHPMRRRAVSAPSAVIFGTETLSRSTDPSIDNL